MILQRIIKGQRMITYFLSKGFNFELPEFRVLEALIL